MQGSCQTAPTTATRRAFSLVELLVVIGILSLLLVAAFPVFNNNSNSARTASREIIKAYLQQARAHAIASGNATAFAIPTLTSDPTLGARSAALVEVESPAGTYIPIKQKDPAGNPLQNDSIVQRFTKLSGNFYFLSSSQFSPPQSTILDSALPLSVTANGRIIPCLAIIFSPNGQLIHPPPGTPIRIAIGQAAKRNGSLTLTDQNAGQPTFELLQVNRLTGRTKFYQAP